MTSKAKQLALLKEITTLKAEVGRAKLTAHRTIIEGIEDAIAAVDAAQSDAVPQSVQDAAATANYAHWAMQRRQALRSDLAMAMARAQPVKEKAAKDEARAQVVKRLTKKVSKPADQ